MPSAPPQIHLTLLGSFRLERDSRAINLPTRKAESLLAYLALFPEPHPREKLAALFWGDSTDEQARHSLRTALTRIRKELGDDPLVADRDTVQLLPIWVDAKEFERLANSEWRMAESPDAISHLQSAIRSYANLLPDFYDDWVVRERERLHAIYVDALLQLAQLFRSKSDYTKAIEFAQKVLAVDRANEKAYQHLMFCFAAQGDRIAALKQYDECKKVLRDELNAEPSSETTALRDQIMAELTGAPSREAAMTNLPNPLTSFVGRENELRESKNLLGSTRLLTLTGAGGCGKTRLAIELARTLVDDFKNGVWWVELATVSDPALVPRTVANVFDLRGSADVQSLKPLTDFLHAKNLLLVLDNCEHLITACAELANKLLLACPNLKIIPTSREGLNVLGETVWRVPSLAVPSIEHLPSLDQLGDYDSIKLFTQRAAAVSPNWKLDGNARAVAQICARLDGIPLAIELAAARVKGLVVEEIAKRLDDRFKLLVGGNRAALLRQQTLRATIEWSHNLLSDSERAVFHQLSVFVGGWTLEAAESVCADDAIQSSDVVNLLTKLVDKSLVNVEEHEGKMRYQTLETIREYAYEKLIESGELDSACDRHLNYFVEFGKRAEQKLMDWDEQLTWFANIEVEMANLRAAFECSLETNLDLAFQLLWSIRLYWWSGPQCNDWIFRFLSTAEKWDSPRQARIIRLAAHLESTRDRSRELPQRALEIALTTEDPGEIAYAFLRRGIMSRIVGDYETARNHLEKSVALFRQVGDEWFLGWTLNQLVWAVAPSDRALARKLLEEAFSIAQKLKERVLLSRVVNSLGDFERLEGNYRQAVKVLEESLKIREGMMHYKGGKAQRLAMLAHALLSAGDYERAKQVALESLNLARIIDAFTIECPLEVFPRFMLVDQKYAQAARLFAAVDALTDLVGARGIWNAADYEQFNRDVAEVRAHLDPQVFDAAWNEGRKMTMEQAVEYALQNS